MEKVLLTIDVETDWGGRLEVRKEDCQGMIKGVPEILSLLKRYDVKTTFFISGNVANEYKEFIMEIFNQGHEIASHGYDHRDYSKLDDSKLEYQIKRSKSILEGIINREVVGFRVPQFRPNKSLHRLLKKAGYWYDSSVVSGVRFKRRYDHSIYPNSPFILDGIIEVPISTIPFLKLPLGLLWVNAIGFPTFKLLYNYFPLRGEGKCKVKRIEVLYLHPFDILKENSKGDFGITVRAWYNFRSGKALTTLERLLKFYKQRKKTFAAVKQAIYQSHFFKT